MFCFVLFCFFLGVLECVVIIMLHFERKNPIDEPGLWCDFNSDVLVQIKSVKSQRTKASLLPEVQYITCENVFTVEDSGPSLSSVTNYASYLSSHGIGSILSETKASDFKTHINLDPSSVR